MHLVKQFKKLTSYDGRAQEKQRIETEGRRINTKWAISTFWNGKQQENKHCSGS